MRKKIVALYDPYLDVIGGGEKHILSILKIYEELGYEINIFWEDNILSKIEQKLDLHFTNVTVVPNIFSKSGNNIKKLTTLNKYDTFFYITDGSFFFSNAKKNFIFSMIPQRNLYPSSIKDTIKTWNYQYISNSTFTHNWLKKWGFSSQVIYPYLDNIFTSFDLNSISKEKIILSVGRFFRHLHAKKQEVIIEAFRKLKEKNPLFKEYKLILAGSVKPEDQEYVDSIQSSVKDDPSIVIKTNLTFHDLLNLYKRSLFYWHFTGYGVNENEHPEQVEHLGITPLEAMATGCITFCYNAGGPRELITSENGYLFNTIDELTTQTEAIIADHDGQSNMRQQAQQFVKKYFSYEVFKNNVIKLLHP